jgi:hypothetical protein
LGAALAYYSVFSMGPLLLIVASVAGLFFGADAARGSLTAQFHGLLGETGSKAVEAMLAAPAQRNRDASPPSPASSCCSLLPWALSSRRTKTADACSPHKASP